MVVVTYEYASYYMNVRGLQFVVSCETVKLNTVSKLMLNTASDEA